MPEKEDRYIGRWWFMANVLTGFFILASLTGCSERKPDLSNPKTYRAGSLSFDYPGNWEITEDSGDPDFPLLLFETPGSAVLFLETFPIGDATDLKTFSKEFSDNTAADTAIGKVVVSGLSELPDSNGYEWIAEEFQIDLFGESVSHRRLYGMKQIGATKVFLMFQAATEDFRKVEPGFELVRDTLGEAK